MHMVTFEDKESRIDKALTFAQQQAYTLGHTRTRKSISGSETTSVQNQSRTFTEFITAKHLSRQRVESIYEPFHSTHVNSALKKANVNSWTRGARSFKSKVTAAPQAGEERMLLLSCQPEGLSQWLNLYVCHHHYQHQ